MKRKITQLTKVVLTALVVFASGNVFSQTTLIEEIFTIESGELDSDSLDYTATAPEGWVVKNCYSSGKNNYDLSDTDESNGVMFKSNESYIVTPAVDKPGVLTFWAKYKDAIEGAELIIEKSIDGGDYIKVASITTLGAEFAEFTVNIDDLSSNVKIKFSSYSGDDYSEYKFYLDYVVVLESTATGVEALSATNNFKIMGNYVDNSLKFETTSNKGQITVFDMVGRVVIQDTYAGTKSIDVSNLNTGSYILIFNDESGSYSEKFQKK
jgi:hypothetical protein